MGGGKVKKEGNTKRINESSSVKVISFFIAGMYEFRTALSHKILKCIVFSFNFHRLDLLLFVIKCKISSYNI